MTDAPSTAAASNHPRNIPDREALQFFWESLKEGQQAAIMHSVNQQVTRCVNSVPEILRASVDTHAFSTRYRDEMLKDIYTGKVELQTYETDYRGFLDRQHSIGSNDSGIGMGSTSTPVRSVTGEAAAG